VSAVAAPELPTQPVLRDLFARFADADFTAQETADRAPTLWVPAARLHEVLRYLKNEVSRPYRMLFDLTAVDERVRKHRHH